MQTKVVTTFKPADKKIQDQVSCLEQEKNTAAYLSHVANFRSFGAACHVHGMLSNAWPCCCQGCMACSTQQSHCLEWVCQRTKSCRAHHLTVDPDAVGEGTCCLHNVRPKMSDATGRQAICIACLLHLAIHIACLECPLVPAKQDRARGTMTRLGFEWHQSAHRKNGELQKLWKKIRSEMASMSLDCPKLSYLTCIILVLGITPSIINLLIH